MSYSSNGNRPKLSEKGLLTPDNCVVALIDHQGQMLFGTSNFDRQGIINNTVAFGTLSLRSRKADAKRSCLPACGRRLASRFPRYRRYTTATKSTWWKIAAVT